LVGYELERLGVENYLVEIGGEIRTKGLNPKGALWKIGIDKPVDGNMIQGANVQQVVYMGDGALATSGNYRKFYEVEGIKYSHTIDPISGYPVRHTLLSATVFASDVMTADAYATWFMVVGLEKSIEIIESIHDIEAFLIYSQGEEFAVYSSSGVNLGEQ
jgi:thiamine biosynthesis lipoprotein